MMGSGLSTHAHTRLHLSPYFCAPLAGPLDGWRWCECARCLALVMLLPEAESMTKLGRTGRGERPPRTVGRGGAEAHRLRSGMGISSRAPLSSPAALPATWREGGVEREGKGVRLRGYMKRERGFWGEPRVCLSI